MPVRSIRASTGTSGSSTSRSRLVPPASSSGVTWAARTRPVAAARAVGAQLFINDHWELALEEGAYGVHLGQQDLPAADLPRLASAGLLDGPPTGQALLEQIKAKMLAPPEAQKALEAALLAEEKRDRNGTMLAVSAGGGALETVSSGDGGSEARPLYTLGPIAGSGTRAAR